MAATVSVNLPDSGSPHPNLVSLPRSAAVIVKFAGEGAWMANSPRCYSHISLTHKRPVSHSGLSSNIRGNSNIHNDPSPWMLRKYSLRGGCRHEHKGRKVAVDHYLSNETEDAGDDD